MSWRVGNFLPVMLGLWPVLALSGTLAGEAAKGSLDLLASTPHSRSSIALEKLAGHVTAVVFAMAILALAIFGLGQAFARLPGDEITFAAAFGQAALYGVMMLAAGGAAFAAAPFLGRTRGLGVGLIVLFASYLIYGYSTLSPIIEALKPLSFFVWTAGHRPIAGVTDWPSVGRAWRRGPGRSSRSACSRSHDATWARARTSAGSDCRRSRPGSRGPFSRQLADRFGIALAWGVGIGRIRDPDRRLGRCVREDDLVGPHAQRGDRGGLSGPRPHPAVGAAPADVLQLRVVHPRPGRSVVPRRLGRRRRPSSARGRPVDAAVACQLGGPQRARRPGRDRGRDGHHRGPDRDRDRLAGPETWSRRSSASASSGWRPRPLPPSGSRSAGLFRLSLGRRRDRLPGHRHAPHRYPRARRSSCPTSSSICRSTSTSASRSPGSSTRSGSSVAVVMVVGGVAICAFGLTRRDIGR